MGTQVSVLTSNLGFLRPQVAVPHPEVCLLARPVASVPSAGLGAGLPVCPSFRVRASWTVATTGMLRSWKLRAELDT